MMTKGRQISAVLLVISSAALLIFGGTFLFSTEDSSPDQAVVMPPLSHRKAVKTDGQKSNGGANDADTADSEPDSDQPTDEPQPEEEISACGIGNAEEVAEGCPRPLIIIRPRDGERFVLTPETEEGGFDAQDHKLAEQAFVWRSTTKTKKVHPRLINHLYKTVRHFEAPHLFLTSGFRPSEKASYHAWGQAADFRLPRVDYRKIAAHMRGYGFSGVGMYPRTKSVHLDVRTKSFFWVSWAPRGIYWREYGHLHGAAKRADRLAAKRGIRPVEPLPKSGTTARDVKRWKNRRSPPVVRTKQK